MARIPCVNRACPYADKLTNDGLCEINARVTHEIMSNPTQNGEVVGFLAISVVAKSEEECKRKRDCLTEYMDNMGDNISADVI
jgi:hypothetical protein